MIYLDNAATTKIDDRVVDAMLPYLKENYGNPGGLYSIGEISRKAVSEARESVAAMFGCSPEHIVFTSGGSEGNNTVIRNPYLNGGTVAISNIEHESTIKSATREFCQPIIIPTDSEGVNVEFLENECRECAMVSVMAVNNETGQVLNTGEIAEWCKSRGVMFHTDCVQAAGLNLPRADEIEYDFATISSHKIHGPKGMGAIYVRYPDRLKPLIYGGGSQEFGLRGGTENVAGIVGFGKACELAMENLPNLSEHYRKLRTYFMESYLDYSGKSIYDVMVNGNSGKVINFRTDVYSDTLVMALGDIACISAGSACTSHNNTPSHVLKAMGISDEDARKSIRISFSRMSTIDDAIKGGIEVAKAEEIVIDAGL